MQDAIYHQVFIKHHIDGMIPYNINWIQTKVRKRSQSFKNVRIVGGKGGAHMLIASNYQKMWTQFQQQKKPMTSIRLKLSLWVFGNNIFIRVKWEDLSKIIFWFWIN